MLKGLIHFHCCYSNIYLCEKSDEITFILLMQIKISPQSQEPVTNLFVWLTYFKVITLFYFCGK